LEEAHCGAQRHGFDPLISIPSYHHVLPSREFGGAAEVAFRLMDYARAKAAGKSYLWLPGAGRAWDKAVEERLPVRAYRQPNIAHDSRASMALANLRLGWNWRNFRPGILHLHSAELYGGLPVACALSKLKRVVHIHLEQEEATIRWAFRRLPELVVTCADFLVENVRRYLTPAQRDRLRIVSVPNCIDTNRFHPGDKASAKRALGASTQRPLVLMLANLAPHKGQATALRAIAALKQQQVPVNCWIAGVDREANGNYQLQLETLIQELNLQDSVRLLGYRSDGPELLRAADLFLLPSTREGLPLSVLEAQASQVPVLAAPTAGIPEVVRDGETGYLIPADDAAGYAQRMAKLLTYPDLRNAMVEKAFRQVREKHHVAAYCERIWSLYEELLAASSNRLGSKAALL
jgi:glycosyltransferase involved in cell wall biosynthesis